MKQVPYRFEPELLVILAVTAASGLFVILNEWRKKHFGIQTTGTIIGVSSARRSATVQISFRLLDGTKVVGKFSSIGIGVLPYTKKIGAEIEISYFEKKPQKVTILSSKINYIIGAFLLFLTLSYGYMLLFLL